MILKANMVNFLKKRSLNLAIFLLIAALFFLLRIPNLTLQPIFADEAIYIRWAQIMKAEPTLRFLPLSDGKTPLFMWAMAPLFKVFDDPLYAGRFLSVMAGFATFIGALFLGWKFFNLRIGLWSALLIAVMPFMVFFDRMALVDSMLAAFSLWSLILALLVIRYQRIDLAMGLGYSLGGALLTKTPAMFNLLVLPFTILAANSTVAGKERRFLKIIGLWVIAIGISLLMYNALRLGPGFDKLSARNQDYIFSPLELVDRPLDPFLPHFNDVKEFFVKLIGTVGSALIVFGIVLAVVKGNRIALVILFWSLVPLFIEMAFLKTFTARYILFSIPPLLCLSGWMIGETEKWVVGKVKNKVLPTLFILGILLLYPLQFNYNLLTNPSSANIPRNDHKGYFEEWTAGYGFPEIANFLIEKSRSGPLVVVTEGFFGTLPDGLQIYLEKYIHQVGKEKQIVVRGTNGIEIGSDLREASRTIPVYFIANRSRSDPFPGGVQLIKEFPKNQTFSKSQEMILLFKVLPEAEK